ncbi:MAG: hypothetical protein KF781_02070 [Chitinophagaceae bacterium]|nr:hypothetical protein [Chitinophagaceae bacterium]MCW5904295.1 hypothetical protein [Chitinophagaceae bacterium]
MKKIFTLALATVIVFTVNAQDKKESSSKGFSFGVGPSLSFPMGNFGKTYSFGIGAELQATYHASESFEGFAQVGYNNFSGKSISGFKVPSIGFIPVLVGGRYVSSGFTVGAGVGFGSFTKGGGSGFMYSPQVGYSFGNIQVLAHYSGVSAKGGGSLSFFGLKAFYNF